MRIGSKQPPQVGLYKGRVTIDVERPDRQAVNFSDWRARLAAPAPVGSARFVIGVAVDGVLHAADLSQSQCPHLLVAGTTGSGKSEWLRAFLASLLAVNTPAYPAPRADRPEASCLRRIRTQPLPLAAGGAR